MRREPEAALLMSLRRDGDEAGPPETRDALERALIAQAGDLVGFLTHHVGNPDTAADIAQEALARALASLHRLRKSSALRGWLFRIALNCFNDHLRRQRPQRDDVDLTESPEPTVSRDHEPERDVLNRELDALLRREVLRLPERQRTVLLLHGVEGVDQPTIAELLGISRAAVKMSLFHARERLRERLDRYLGRRLHPKDDVS